MISLPPIQLASHSFYLPLSEDSARQIATILLHEEPAERVAMWTGLLAVDPPLLFWATLLIHRAGQDAPREINTVAQWLAPRALAILDWSAEHVSTQELPAAQSTLWREVMQRCLPCCQLDSDGSFPANLRITLGCLLQAIEAAELDFPLESLPDSLAALAETSSTTQQPADSTSEGIAPELKRALRRWRTRTTGSGGLLPRLTARLRRLAALEGNFEQTLLHEKLSAMRELAYGASHEINNPLANISTRAQTLLQEEHDPERRRKLATIHLQAMRAHEMIANLMHFAKPPQLLAEPVDLADCLATVVEELAEWAAEQGTAVKVSIPQQRPMIEGDSQQIMIALRGLLRNSLEALAAGGLIEAEVMVSQPEHAVQRRGERPVGSDEGDRGAIGSVAEVMPEAVVRVRDNGPGVSEEARPHLFDPFYSGREAGRGLGFGLAWSWRIVERHGGRIETISQAGHGAEFRLCLPLLTCS